METIPTKNQIDKAKKSNPWDFGNQFLYTLCRNNFTHDKDDRILTKVLFIGRIYAAATERRKNKTSDINDNFYIDTVAPTFRKSKLDIRLMKLKQIKNVSVDNISEVLEVHHYLTTTIKTITALDKRSFSSKYLHFHLPNIFFIYDSRVVKALRQYKCKVPKDLEYLIKLSNVDKEYAKFFCKCFDLKKQIDIKHKTNLSNRQLDNVLINIANKKNKANVI